MHIKDIYSKALTIVMACALCCGTSMAATQITYADQRTVTFVAGDDATCATTSLSCASEGSVTSVTLPVASVIVCATFKG